VSCGEKEKGKEESSQQKLIKSGVCVLNTRLLIGIAAQLRAGEGLVIGKRKKEKESWDAGPLLFIALLTGLESPRISLNFT